MPIGERDYSINHPVELSKWDAVGQMIGANDESEMKFIYITFDYNLTKYQAGVANSTGLENTIFTGIGTRSYNEMKKQLIKFLYQNEINCGIPQKEDFWDLICKVN